MLFRQSYISTLLKIVRGPLGAPKARGPLGVALTLTTVRYGTAKGIHGTHRHKSSIELYFKHIYIPWGGAVSTYTDGESVQKIFRQPKNITPASLQPKNITSFYTLNLCINIKYPKTMQTEGRIAPSEPRNIRSTIFDVKKYPEHKISFIWIQKCHFGGLIEWR